MQKRQLDHVYAAEPESSSPDILKTGEDSGGLRMRSEEGYEWGAICFQVETGAPPANAVVSENSNELWPQDFRLFLLHSLDA